MEGLSAAPAETVAFPADLTNPGSTLALVRSIEERLGSIDVAIYSPVPTGAAFVPAVEFDAWRSLARGAIGPQPSDPQRSGRRR